MLAYVVLIALVGVSIFLSFYDFKKLLIFILLTAGFPVSILTPSANLFGFAGGMAPEAAFLLIQVFILFALCVAQPKAIGISLAKLWPHFVFLSFCLISVTWSQDTTHGLRFFVKLLAPVLLFSLVIFSIESAQDVAAAEKTIIIGCSVILVLALINTATDGGLGGEFGRAKWQGTGVLVAPYKSPANFSFLLSVSAIFCLANFFLYRNKVYLLLYGMFALAVFASFTRISMAALIVSSFIVIFFLSRSLIMRFVFPFAVILISTISVFLYQPLRERMFFSSTNIDLANLSVEQLGESINTSGRTYLWQQAWEYFEHSDKIIGAGAGSVDAWLRSHSGAAALHSEYLHLFIDLGIVGLLLFLFSVFLLLKTAIKTSKTTQTEVNTELKYRAIFIALLFFYLTTMLTDNTLNYISDIGFHLFFSFAVLTLSRLKPLDFIPCSNDSRTSLRPGRETMFNLS